MPNQCVLCGAAAFPAMREGCLICEPSILYCSSHCREADWPLHKLLCDDLALLKLNPRPTPSSKIAILFPPTSNHPDLTSRSPEVIFVDCPQLQHDGKVFEMPEIKPHLGAGDPRPEKISMSRNVLKGFDIGYTLVLFRRGDWMKDGSAQNLAVREVTKGRSAGEWYGEVVVLSQIGVPDDPYARYQDITLRDLRIVVDYFLGHGV